MNTIWRISLLLFVICLCYCRDYYIGMFKRNDFLVAQDRLYKEKVPFHRVVAKYGRVFKCPITYFRVLDRLGYGGGPRVEVIRGGLRKKYIVARITSPFNIPISVNVYIGCENKMTTTKRTTTTTATRKDSKQTAPDEGEEKNPDITTAGDGNGNSTDTGGDDAGQETTKSGGDKEEENKDAETTKNPNEQDDDNQNSDKPDNENPDEDKADTEKPDDAK